MPCRSCPFLLAIHVIVQKEHKRRGRTIKVWIHGHQQPIWEARCLGFVTWQVTSLSTGEICMLCSWFERPLCIEYDQNVVLFHHVKIDATMFVFLNWPFITSHRLMKLCCWIANLSNSHDHYLCMTNLLWFLYVSRSMVLQVSAEKRVYASCVSDFLPSFRSTKSCKDLKFKMFFWV